MKIGLTINNNRLSSVFGAAEQLLVIEIDNDASERKGLIDLDCETIFEKVKILQTNGVKLLICGAISGCYEQIIENSGISVIGFICGDIETIIAEFQKNRLTGSFCKMPGRCNNQRRQQRRHCRHNEH